jgi:FLYWCH zinc finger domain
VLINEVYIEKTIYVFTHYCDFPVMSIVKSSKGKDQLLLDGFRYRHANKSQTTWRCVKNNCAGRITFDDTQYIKLTDHIHAPNPDDIIAAEFKSKMIERAITSHDPPRRIIHEGLLNVEKDDATALPSYTALQRTIERKRKANDIPLPSPTSFQDIIIPHELRLTNSGDRFLLYDNEDINARIIVFSSNSDLNRLSRSEHWHADGTYKVSKYKFIGILKMVFYL